MSTVVVLELGPTVIQVLAVGCAGMKQGDWKQELNMLRCGAIVAGIFERQRIWPAEQKWSGEQKGVSGG